MYPFVLPSLFFTGHLYLAITDTDIPSLGLINHSQQNPLSA